jgi:hypothetical protein
MDNSLGVKWAVAEDFLKSLLERPRISGQDYVTVLEVCNSLLSFKMPQNKYQRIIEIINE